MTRVLIFNFGGKPELIRRPGGEGVDYTLAQGWSDLSGHLKEEESFDLVILDSVPRKARPRFTKRIRKIRDIPVIFFEESRPEKKPRKGARGRKKAKSAKPGKTRSRVSTADDSLERARRFMDNNFQRQLSLFEIASVAEITASYFCRRFKARFGIPPIKYLRKLRIAHASYLLENTNLPLSEVSGQSGFLSVPYFCREFNKFSGTTPIGYRRKKLKRTRKRK